MTEKIALFQKGLKDKKICVIGIGVSNLPLMRYLAQHGANVTACDRRGQEDLAEEMALLSQYSITYRLGEGYLDNLEGDIIFKTPGLRFDVPQLLAAKEAGKVITSEMEVFFDLCPCKMIAVTGSDGKTTTTTLISEMLKHAGYKVWLGGNIGKPLLADVDKISPDDIAVLELSSFQLHTMKASPDIAVVTNLSPNHLDMHKDMNEYIDAKKNIFLHQGKEGKLVLNYDNEITHGFAEEAQGGVRFFSRRTPLEDGVSLLDGQICMDGKVVMPPDEIRLPGVHNMENYMAAIAAVWELVKAEDITEVARTFGGVEHRMEFVRELDGVRYYNDSIASSPTRTTAGLKSFTQKVILIAGGYDKHLPFDEFGGIIKEHVNQLFLIGVTAPAIAAAARKAGMEEITMCTSLREAVALAKQAARAGDVVILSPACASFDMFKNFEERGNAFKELVGSLS